LLNRKNLTIDVHLDGGMPTAFVDPLRIRQVLLNLLSNAVRHTTAGGITVRAWSECDNVIITVVDTGEGIDPRELPRLFDPFYRLAPSTGGHDGWGLGLAICRQFISLHGGTIDAASEGVPGRGTSFTITLPIHAPAASPPTDKRRKGRSAGQLTASAPSASVVVLDSDPHVVSLFRRRLSDYHVHGADSEHAALELAEAVDAHALVVRAPPPEQHATWHRHWSTIAVVDDDRHMVRMLSRMLRSAGRGWRLLRAYDGQEGWELIKKTRPELVLVDLTMPRIGGLELLQWVRSDPALAGVELIAVSVLDVMDVLPSSDERRLELLTGRGTTISQILRGVQVLLDALPPAETGPPNTDRAPARVPVG
jgi:CheY-like chemotaxis protein